MVASRKSELQSINNAVNVGRLKIVWNIAECGSLRIITAKSLRVGPSRGCLGRGGLLFGVHPISGHVEKLFERQDDGNISVIMKIELTLLLFDVIRIVFLVLRISDPDVISQVGRRAHFGYLILLLLILRESLLHTLTKEVLAVFRKTVEDLDHRQDLLVLLFAHSRVVFDGVDHTAASLNVWYPCQELLIDHFETTSRCQND